jgi:hypothetical protein
MALMIAVMQTLHLCGHVDNVKTTNAQDDELHTHFLFSILKVLLSSRHLCIGGARQCIPVSTDGVLHHSLVFLHSLHHRVHCCEYHQEKLLVLIPNILP